MGDGETKMNGGDAFTALYRQVEPRLRRALVAAYGIDRGREATAEALTWAWAHPDRLTTIDNAVSYLYRVGQSRTRRRLHRHLVHRPEWPEPWVEPGLARALSRLSERQRVTVMLIHGYDWTLGEVADLLDVKATTVQNHLERGMAKLRTDLEAPPDARP